MTSDREKDDTICGAPVVAFSFNRDRSEAVFSPNNQQLLVVRCEDLGRCASWETQAVLEQHDQCVSAAAWHGATDQILSCAHDRIAYVWCRDEKKMWRPQMVLLDVGVKRGLTCCAWNFSGSKIYVGSADANIAVGRFDSEEQWWICRFLSVHNSTVTALAPHPFDDARLASGGTDGKLLILSTYMKKLDASKAEPFGHVYFQKEFGSWVHAIAWSPSGARLVVSTHDSRIHVFDMPSGSDLLQESAVVSNVVELTILPLKSLAFVGETRIVGGGFDFYPVLFSLVDQEWKMTGKWTVSRPKEVATAQQVARARFQEQTQQVSADIFEEEHSRHENTINYVCCLISESDDLGTIEDRLTEHCPLFATASLDGRVEVWSLSDMTCI
uniref:Arp2/3 complex 41 kDa subunit n=1 Tax=Trypanosoma congolense (strain IL3000) TaxID=1068625 RepID=G0UY82_TRYCI|nr:unnamed protein product [Trypanosoma congolense IL3000]